MIFITFHTNSTSSHKALRTAFNAFHREVKLEKKILHINLINNRNCVQFQLNKVFQTRQHDTEVDYDEQYKKIISETPRCLS